MFAMFVDPQVLPPTVRGGSILHIQDPPPSPQRGGEGRFEVLEVL